MEFSEKPLSSIPIKLINWQDKNEVEIYNKILNLVDKIIKEKNWQDNLEKLNKLVIELYELS